MEGENEIRLDGFIVGAVVIFNHHESVERQQGGFTIP